MKYKKTIATLKSLDAFLDVIRYNNTEIKENIKASLKELDEALTIPIVSNRRELLIDFLDKLENTQDKVVPYNRNSVIADKYLEGNL